MIEFSDEKIERIKPVGGDAEAGSGPSTQEQQALGDLWPDRGYFHHERHPSQSKKNDGAVAEKDESQAESARERPIQMSTKNSTTSTALQSTRLRENHHHRRRVAILTTVISVFAQDFVT